MDDLAHLLATRREDILRRFEREVRERLLTKDCPRSALLDTLPALLDGLGAALRDGGRESVDPAPGVARPGESLSQRVAEYGVLRECLLGVLTEAGGAPRGEELGTLHRWLDAEVGEAVARAEREWDAERARAEGQLRRVAEFRECFLKLVGHDLRNPLNAILLSATTMLRDEGQAERTTRGLRRVSASAERMGRMIAELLDYTRGRLGGGIALHRQTADAREVSLGVLEALGEARPERELCFHAEGALRGDWDVERLGHLVGHLATHALDVGAEGTPVTVAVYGEEDAVRIEVTHEGPPLSEEALADLFEPFHKGARKSRGAPVSGLGLGLYIAREIARAHGGTVEACSSDLEGTRFTARLPRA